MFDEPVVQVTGRLDPYPGDCAGTSRIGIYGKAGDHKLKTFSSQTAVSHGHFQTNLRPAVSSN